MKIPQIPNDTVRYGALHELLKANFEVIKFGAEVGVRHGFTSRYLLEQNSELFLFLIDNYQPYKDMHEELTALEQNEHKINARNFLQDFESHDRLVWLYMDSVVAATLVKDESLDFAFIDANHETEHVYKDALAWYPKVKKGGYLIGHDFCVDSVKEAVKRTGFKAARMICEGDLWIVEV